MCVCACVKVCMGCALSSSLCTWTATQRGTQLMTADKPAGGLRQHGSAALGEHVLDGGFGPCCTQERAKPCGFAALQHERNHQVAPLEAGLASTRQAASVLLVFTESLQHPVLYFAILSHLHTSPCGNQPFWVFQKPILMPFCLDYSSGQTQFLISPLFFRSEQAK